MAIEEQNQRKSSGNNTTGESLISQAKKEKETQYNQYKYFLEEDIIYMDKKDSKLFINKELIKVIIIERDYEYGNMPFLLIRGGVQDTTLLRIALGLPDGQMHLKISKGIPGFDNNERNDFSKNEKSSDQYINKTIYIDDTFQVMMEDQSMRMYAKFANRDTESSSPGDEVKENDERDNEEILNVGLVKKEHLIRTKKIFNCIIPSGTPTIDILSFFFSEAGFDKLLISNPDNTSNSKDLIIPPMNFLDVLEYYNNLRGIYKTKYRFFQDFKRTYMLDTSGKCTAYEKKEPKKIAIFITSYGQTSSLTYGMASMNKSSNTGASKSDGEELILSIPQNNIEISADAAFSKEMQFSSMMDIGMRGNTQHNSKVSGIAGYENTIIRKNLYANNFLGAGEASAVSESNIIIRATLVDIDIDAFTPNKEYVIQFGDANYKDLQGIYRLIKITTMLERATDEFTMYAMVEFRKIP